MKSTQILTIVSLTAAFALTGCEEKKAEPTPPAPEPVKPAEPAMKPAAPAPAPAAPAPAAPAPAAPAPAAPAPAPAAAAPAATSASETAAIEAFKKEVGEIGKFTQEKMKAAGATDPMAGMAAMSEVFAKLKAVKTDAMPADFKTAWGDLNGAFGEMGELFKGLPKAEKPEDGMKAMMELMPKLQAIQGKLDPAMKKVEELGKKYGFEMDKLMPKQ